MNSEINFDLATNPSMSLKAALFDLISHEQNKLLEIRNLVSQGNYEDVKDDVLSLCDNEESFLKELMISGNDFATIIERIEKCSNSFDILLSVDKNDELSYDVESTNDIENVETNNTVVDQTQDDDKSLENVENTNNKLINFTDFLNEVSNNNEAVNKEETPQALSDEDIANPSGNVEESSEVVEDTNETEEVQPVLPQALSDEDIANPGGNVEESSEVVENSNEKEGVQPVLPQALSDEDIANPSGSAEESSEVVEGTNEKEEVQPVIPQPLSEEENQEASQDVITDDEDSSFENDEISDEDEVDSATDLSNDADQEEKNDSNEDIIPVVNIPLEDEEKVAELPKKDDINIETPLIPIISDGKQENTSENIESQPVIPIVEGGIPEISEENGNLNVDIPNYEEEKIVYKKKNTDPPKAILTTKKQITNLRSSLATQEALMNMKSSGFDSQGASTLNDIMTLGVGSDTSSPEDKQAKIESLLEQANELYKEGKVEESQAIYDQISVLNKELQESSSSLSM